VRRARLTRRRLNALLGAVNHTGTLISGNAFIQ